MPVAERNDRASQPPGNATSKLAYSMYSFSPWLSVYFNITPNIGFIYPSINSNYPVKFYQKREKILNLSYKMVPF